MDNPIIKKENLVNQDLLRMLAKYLFQSMKKKRILSLQNRIKFQIRTFGFISTKLNLYQKEILLTPCTKNGGAITHFWKNTMDSSNGSFPMHFNRDLTFIRNHFKKRKKNISDKIAKLQKDM